MKVDNLPQKKKRENIFQNIIFTIVSLGIFFISGEIITGLAIGHPLITQPDGILFWKYKKDQVGHQKLYSPISRVDRNGFRYSGKEFAPDLPSVYIGGDSYAWGEGVLDTETFSGHLQRLLDTNCLNYNVLNGGVPGYGIEQIIYRMEIECEKYRPRYSIFLWVEGDINRMRDISPELKRRYLRDYRLRSLFRYSAFLKMIKEQVFDKILQKDLGLGYFGDRNIEYEKAHTFDEKVRDLTPKIVDSVRFLKSKNIVPIWIYVTLPSKEFKDYLNALSKEMPVVLIDPEAAYRRFFPELKQMSTGLSGHFKPEVYRILAEEVFNNIFYKQPGDG